MSENRGVYVLRLMTELATKEVAKVIGANGCWLVIAVARKQDQLQTDGPVLLWLEELCGWLGYSGKKDAIRVRDKAVAAGWLKYDPPPNGSLKPGEYQVLIPGGFLNPTVSQTGHGSGNGLTSTVSQTGNGSGNGSGNHSLLLPKPIPKPDKRPRFVPPSLDDVRAYCQERKNTVDPEQFIDHYSANGWVQGKGKPIRDWRAAVRTWERNRLQYSLPTNGTQAVMTQSPPTPALRRPPR